MRSRHLERVRQICFALPETQERLSHSMPAFFARNKVFAMFADNHHGDGRLAAWLPGPPGRQKILAQAWPETYLRPPDVGSRGWVGGPRGRVSAQELATHVREACRSVARKSQRALVVSNAGDGPVQDNDDG